MVGKKKSIPVMKLPLATFLFLCNITVPGLGKLSNTFINFHWNNSIRKDSVLVEKKRKREAATR